MSTRLGTVASVKQLIKLSKKVVRVLVEGKNRAGPSRELKQTDPYLQCRSRSFWKNRKISELPDDPMNAEAMMRGLEGNYYRNMQQRMERFPKNLLQKFYDITDLKRLVNDSGCEYSIGVRRIHQELLEELDILQ